MAAKSQVASCGVKDKNGHWIEKSKRSVTGQISAGLLCALISVIRMFALFTRKLPSRQLRGDGHYVPLSSTLAIARQLTLYIANRAELCAFRGIFWALLLLQAALNI